MKLKGKTAFCFPGQLQERPRLEEGHPLRKDPFFKEWLEKVSHQTKFDILNFSFQGGEKECGSPLKLQIATYLLSMAHFYRLRSLGWSPDILAEHSMGIYAALTASEAITFEEGLFITESIGRLIEKEGSRRSGTMASIIGLPLEEIKKICMDLNGQHLFIANYNGSMHFVLSGDGEGIERAISIALSRRAISASKLAFNAALHSPSLLSLEDEIKNLLKNITIKRPRFPILNHWTVRPLAPMEIKEFLSQEIGRPVCWVQCVEKLIQEGVTQFIEVGHQPTLTKLIRWIDREVESFFAGDLM